MVRLFPANTYITFRNEHGWGAGRGGGGLYYNLNLWLRLLHLHLNINIDQNLLPQWTIMEPRQSEARLKPSKVKQACDCCHTRKIRCDGDDPCANCHAADLRCTYLIVPKKKGPKGPRTGKSSAGYRKRREQFLIEVLSPRKQPPIVPQRTEEPQPSADSLCNGAFNFAPSRVISPDVIRRCIDGFFAHKYPIMPILDRDHIYASLESVHEQPEQYALITALCAMIILQPEILGSPVSSKKSCHKSQLPSPELLIAETHRSRLFCNHIETPSLAAVQTSFFLFAASFSLEKDNSAWFYIREAMTMLQLQHFHEEDTYSRIADPQYATYCRRTFWLLFITERAYALQRHRPLTLQKTIELPKVNPGPEAAILSGFLDLVSLFQNFDDTFLSLWNLSSADSTASPQSLVLLQDILEFSLPDVSDRTEIQQADLLVSRQWLKTMVWQLCVTKGLLSSSTTNESMSFQYPVTIARDVVRVSRLLPLKAFEANGVGILEKVFDIGCSLADVLLIHPTVVQTPALEIGPRDYLMELMKIMGTVLGGSSRYLRLLATKADECLQLNLRGSLSESESSNEMVLSEEIDEDDDENWCPEGNARIGHGPHTVDERRDSKTMNSLLSSYGIDPSQDINLLFRTDHSIEAQWTPLSVSRPNRHSFIGANAVANTVS